MNARISSWIFVWFLLANGWVVLDSRADILQTDDWSVEAAEARKSGLPILILFTREYCAYCERLKADVLEPLVKTGGLQDLSIIREIDIARGGKIGDFDGERVRTKIFVKRYGVYVTPTLMLVDNQGNPIGAPIVGFNNFEDYLSYLEKLIAAGGVAPQVAGA